MGPNPKEGTCYSGSDRGAVLHQQRHLSSRRYPRRRDTTSAKRLKNTILLVLDFIRHNRTTDFPKRHSNVLGLPTDETSGKVRVAKEPHITATIRVFLERRGIRSVAHRAKLLLTVRALSAGDSQGYDDALAEAKDLTDGPTRSIIPMNS